ncbi:N-alpha-acetyl-L-2,4-diaminobutyrate deacetylase [Devosia enhydra]|uniref:N-alpha-acetyl-L-2,4-diaminobutyrate deacetylase n=1 Tax=Devosia enhydra TaxID=665118 RepID=A0A1K2HZQ1_9HYPH|nr:succinylglutamate desuccinylase/aspartoacylase family protein [Devosia enhydra]SFZ85553.1 N-alpha-acetyl-L-2,4-diaminobutyrate deacetylase [Devosia enhydra]
MDKAIGPARLTIDPEAQGVSRGALVVPHSHDGSAYGRIEVPVIVVNGRPGPTLLLTGGVHGDEYEGPVALLELARNLRPEGLTGRVIIVPVANPLAFAAGARTSPEDGGNLARLFPGDPAGGITALIAEGIDRLLLPLADCVVDLHAGGKTLDYMPATLARIPEDHVLAGKVIAAMQAFGAPLALAALKSESRGTLVAAALARGIPAFATELGGAGGLSPTTMAIARDGIARMMAHLGIAAARLSDARPRLMLVPPEGYLRAPHAGVFEPIVALGETVAEGDVAGRLWDFNRPDLPPVELAMPAMGLVVCRRVPAIAVAGDVLLHLARDASEADMLPG